MQQTIERIKFNGYTYQIQRYPTGAIYVQEHPRGKGPKVADCLSAFRQHFDKPVFRALTEQENSQYIYAAVAMIHNCMATFVSDEDLVKITGESNWLQFAPFDYFCTCGYAWRSTGGDYPGELQCSQCGKRQKIRLHRLPAGIRRSTLGTGPDQFAYCSSCDDWSTDAFCACGNRKNDGYNCPKCCYDQHAIIKYGPTRYNIGASIEHGGNPVDWTEYRLCLACGTEYETEESSY